MLECTQPKILHFNHFKMYNLVAHGTFTTLYSHNQSPPSFHSVYKYQITTCTPETNLLYVNYTSSEKKEKKDFSLSPTTYSWQLCPHSTDKHHLLKLLLQESLMLLQIWPDMPRIQGPDLLFAQAISQTYICSKQT